MKKIAKKFLVTTLALSVVGMNTSSFASTYEVQPGDTYWKISQKFGVDIHTLIETNNVRENLVLYVGDKIVIPDDEDFYYYEVREGDTPWLISQRFGVSLTEFLAINNFNQYSIIYPGQKVKIPKGEEKFTQKQTEPYVTYITHIVQKGDDFWKLSLKYGIPVNELMKANDANEGTTLYIGQALKIPVHKVPVMETPGPQFGEYLDWWTKAQYVIPIGAVVKVIDFYTGKSFMVKRTTGANHADVETLTYKDTEIMKDIWGGNFSWARRPVLIEYNGRKIAASASGMPHAGNENVSGGAYASERSGGYGAGINLDYVKGNGMSGHFDIHFLNSTKHKDGLVDGEHQNNIKIAAGLIR